MFQPFFAAAMTAPGRQRTFRRAAVGHVLAVAGVTAAGLSAGGPQGLLAVGYLLLTLGIVEGAGLIGWRLTQLPKSPALEFLLTSPVRPPAVLAAEAAVGVCRFALVWLAGLPVLGLLVAAGAVGPADFVLLAGLPLVWGVVAGVGLTAWVYEPAGVRRVGEVVGLLGVLVYLVVGVLAAERLELWLGELPDAARTGIASAVIFLRDWNPFGLVKGWFDRGLTPWVAQERTAIASAAAAGLAAAGVVRAAGRLKGHFHDRHYKPIASDRADQSAAIGDRPLSWWAVRRVMEYSGRVNLWLAGGFCGLYAGYLAAGDRWPGWMGTRVFELFGLWGGAPTVAAAMAVMAGVPAVFQFGLWDATVPDRCRRLELLLLTDLAAADYWRASLKASWRRGRGYLVAAAMLWAALAYSGRVGWAAAAAAAVGGLVGWGFAFAVGFRAFATGTQTSGLASAMTLGLPLVLWQALDRGLGWVGYLIPPGLFYMPVRDGLTWAWAAQAAAYLAATAALTARGLARCDPDLRKWYDANQGKRGGE